MRADAGRQPDGPRAASLGGRYRALGASIKADLESAGLPPFSFKTLAQVAATQVWAAVAAGEVVGGRYLQDCQVAPVDDAPGIRNGVRSYALDPDRARALWTRSEELFDERFP